MGCAKGCTTNLMMMMMVMMMMMMVRCTTNLCLQLTQFTTAFRKVSLHATQKHLASPSSMSSVDASSAQTASLAYLQALGDLLLHSQSPLQIHDHPVRVGRSLDGCSEYVRAPRVSLRRGERH